MTEQRRRGRAWKPDATGERCVRCARTWAGHAASSCYPVPDAAIDAFDPSRPELLELGDVADVSRRSSPSRPGDPVDERDTSLADTRDGSAVDERDGSLAEPQDGSAVGRDVSPVDALQTGRLCAWCTGPIPAVSPGGRRTRADTVTCGVICRKRRNRFLRAVRAGKPARRPSRRADTSRLAGAPGRFAAWHAELGDVEFPSGEHAFQAAKAATVDEHEAIRLARTPMAAKQLGRRAALPADWTTRRPHVMLAVVRAKFARGDLRALLLDTSDAVLAEDSPYDALWGCRDRAGGYTGANLLGRALMRVRDELRTP